MLTPAEIAEYVGQDVSRETTERLAELAGLVRKWTPAINLISKSTVPLLWTRHIADSLQLWPLVPPEPGHWADIGSGGGFPGLVIAILKQELSPETKVTLVESDARKSAFLTTAIRELSLTANVQVARVEQLAPLNADVLSARALAPLSVLLGHAERHLLPSGIGLFPKGAGYRAEVTDALASWAFTAESHSSKTDPEAVILKVGGVTRV